MTTRKRDISEERREQIMAGALKTFSTKGFVRATNKDVAEAAGINSPGLIYHYFKDKKDLFRAVIERYAPPLQIVAHADQVMALPPEEALMRLGMAYVRLMDDDSVAPALKLLLGEALRDAEFARILGEIGPLRVLNVLMQYLKRQMDEGVLRRVDPAQAAICFVGPLISYLIVNNVFQLPIFAAAADDREQMVRTNVSIFLRGLETETESTS